MGKTVLYIIAALTIGGLVVILSVGVGFAPYLFQIEPEKLSPGEFMQAILTSFTFYLAVLWALQSSLEKKARPFMRALMFIAAPVIIMYLSAEWSPVTCVVVLAFIAALPIYQVLVDRSPYTISLP